MRKKINSGKGELGCAILDREGPMEKVTLEERLEK